MEKHCLQSVEVQWRVLAILTPMALRLLQIRTLAQQASETPAIDAVSQDGVPVVTLLQKRPGEIVTAQQLGHAIARLGGYLDLKLTRFWRVPKRGSLSHKGERKRRNVRLLLIGYTI